MAMNPEQGPTGNYTQEAAAGKGFIPIMKGDETWKLLSQCVDWINDRFDGNVEHGFAQTAVAAPTLMATRMALESLWWAEEGLEIDDSIQRFVKQHGEDSFGKIGKYVTAHYVEGAVRRDGQVTPIGGFADQADGVIDLSLPTTLEGLQTLFHLDRLMKRDGVLADFEQEYPLAIPRVLDQVEARWMPSSRVVTEKHRWPKKPTEIVIEAGGFAQSDKNTRPDLWGTHAALELITLATVHRHQTQPEETREWVLRVRERTPLIFQFMKDVESPYGGYGFIAESVPNALSNLHAMKIVDRLAFFDRDSNNPNNPLPKSEFSERFGFGPQIDRIGQSVMRMQDKKTGMFAGYAMGQAWFDAA